METMVNEGKAEWKKTEWERDEGRKENESKGIGIDREK